MNLTVFKSCPLELVINCSLWFSPNLTKTHILLNNSLEYFQPRQLTCTHNHLLLRSLEDHSLTSRKSYKCPNLQFSQGKEHTHTPCWEWPQALLDKFSGLDMHERIQNLQEDSKEYLADTQYFQFYPPITLGRAN